MQTTIIRSRDQDTYHQSPTHVVNAYPADNSWLCTRCQREQSAHTARFFPHRTDFDACGPDSPCFLIGRLCPHCAELFA